MNGLQSKVNTVNARSWGGDRGGVGERNRGLRGYLAHKNLIPNTFDNKMDEWRAWLDDMLGFFEASNPWMGDFSKTITAQGSYPDEVWFQARGTFFRPEVRTDGAEIFRTLKALTSDEAKKIVTSVQSEKGYEAWHKLVHHFNPGLADLQGKALSELSAMIIHRATSPSETKQKVTEVESKIKHAEEIICESKSGVHPESILLGFIDPLTRANTVKPQGADTLFEPFKREVLMFCDGNRSDGRGSAPFQIGSKNFWKQSLRQNSPRAHVSGS